jgi:osmotically-inducible protein OsmY
MAQEVSQLAGTKPVLDTPPIVQQNDEQHRRLARIKRAIRRKTAGGVHDLTVEFQGEAVLLRGQCASFYCKQVAQHAAMTCLSGEALLNEISVTALPR